MKNDSFKNIFLNPLLHLCGIFSRDIGIDLGTANTILYVKNEGIVVNEPSIVAFDKRLNKTIAVGNEAKCMIGRTPENIETIRPMKEGAIANLDISESMLRYFIRQVHDRRTLISPRIVIAVPSGITEVEKRAVKASAEMAGASKVFCIEQAMAAAIGAGLPIHEPAGNMIIDIGGGTTEVAITSMGGTVFSESLRIGGDAHDEAIVNHLKTAHNLSIGLRTAEQIKITIGSAYKLDEELTLEVRGNDIAAGLPRQLVVTSQEVRKAMEDPISSIVKAVRHALEKCPPELSADLIDHGLFLAGGGALLTGMDKLIAQETGLPVSIADDPLTSVALGTGRIVEDEELLERIAWINI